MLIPFCKNYLEGGEKRNELMEEELKSRTLNKRVTQFKNVYNIIETIFDIRKPGNGCKERRKNMGAHSFKDRSSKLASGRELMIAHFIQI
jgi:hypothetical protein